MNKGDKYNPEWGKNKDVLGTLSMAEGRKMAAGDTRFNTGEKLYMLLGSCH